MSSLKCSSSLLCLSWTNRFFIVSHKAKLSWLSHPNTNPNHHLLSSKSTRQYGVVAASLNFTPISGLEEVFTGYIFGKKKSTEVAHLVWKHVVRKGDTVIDATCGNGFDTLAMLKLVADESRTGRVYGMDIQKEALESTSSLLDESVDLDKKELVKLFPICHSRMEEVVPDGTFVRLAAFNLGYLPGGDKTITTVSGSTVLALEASTRILASGGLISILVYVGHPGGREEYEAVQGFACGLSVESWVCCKLEMLNRPLAPVLIFIFKR